MTVGGLHLGIDLGGTKIAGIVLDESGAVHAEARVATPQGDYGATLDAIHGLVSRLERDSRATCPAVGMGTPGTWDLLAGAMRGCNSTCLNGRPLKTDLEQRLQRPVVLANDANCLALSECEDGAVAGLKTVFAVILGTGVGGGMVVNGRHWAGRHGIAGEWGHCPLPQPRMTRHCWCGRRDCVETHLAGPALAARGGYPDVPALLAAADSGVPDAARVLAEWMDDLARALSVVINMLDPEAIVFGGGVSRIPGLCARLEQALGSYVFTPRLATILRLSMHGDASGVRGAARLASLPLN